MRIFDFLSQEESHPSWVRGLKHRNAFDLSHRHMSHPSWVRGLKPYASQIAAAARDVAPLVGAWIETYFAKRPLWLQTSHPSWVRGLKLFTLFFWEE